MTMGWGAGLAGIAMGAGVAFAGFHVGDSLIEMRQANRVVTVKGLAEKDVRADLATWRIPFRGVGDTSRAALGEIERYRKAVQSFVRQDVGEDALSDAEIENEPTSLRIERTVVKVGEEAVERVRYVAVGGLRLRTTKVDLLAALSSRTQELLDAGVLLGDSDYGGASAPNYLFTKLNDIKPALIAASTKAARDSADQFAEDSGAKVGGIASANQGVIQIRARTQGLNEITERDKTVRVVSTIRYFLVD